MIEQPFNIDDYKDITCMDDFYDLLKPPFEGKWCVNQVHLTPENNLKLKEFITTNYKRHKLLKRLKGRHLENALTYDWANYSPRDAEDIPSDVVRFDFEEK